LKTKLLTTAAPRKSLANCESQVRIVNTALFIAGCVLFLIMLLSWHQDWVPAGKKGWKQILRLGIGSNIIAGGILVMFVELKLRNLL
jgi:hypothetical protein